VEDSFFEHVKDGQEIELDADSGTITVFEA
jgi:hypothetical protein